MALRPDFNSVIVGAGGITDGVSALRMLNAGANLLQVCAGRFRSLIFGAALCLSACIASPDYVDHSVLRVDVLPDGTRCRIRGKEMACPDVTNYVRDTLKLKPGSPVGFVSIGELHEESIQALRASLAAAGYTIKSTMK